MPRGRERWAFDERILGSTDFVLRTLSELPAKSAAAGPDAIESLLCTVARRCSVAVAEIRSNSHRPAVVTARALVSYVAIRRYGLTPTAVATQLNISRRSVARSFERAQQSCIADPELAKLLG